MFILTVLISNRNVRNKLRIMQQHFYDAYRNYEKGPPTVKDIWFTKFVVRIVIFFNFTFNCTTLCFSIVS